MPKGACLLLVRRKDDPSAVSAMSHAAFPTPPPEIEACSGDEGDVVVVRVGPEHVSDLVETFRGAAIDESSPATVSLRFDATGPFAVSPAQVASLAEALRSPPLVGRVSELWLDECWLGREGWSTLAPVAREGADAFTSIRAVGDEIDEVAAAHVAVTLEKCTNLRSLCLARNPMGDAGAVALAPGLAACASLTALTVSRCGIGDAGAAAVARALPSTLIALDASSNEMTSLGLGHLAAEIRAGRTPSLTRLNLSGNDVGPGEVPNSPRRCRLVRRNSKHWIFADVFSPIPGSDGLHRHCRSASASRRYISAATARETRRRRRLPPRSQTVRDWRSSAWR